MDEFEESWDQTRQMKLQTLGRTFSASGLLVGGLANLVVLYFTFGFYLAAAETPVGTSIRPMGLTFLYFIIGLGSWIIGIPLSLIGAFMYNKAGHEKGAAMGLGGAILSSLPLPIAFGLFYWITAHFGLILAD